jgi:hypothetical protein
VSWLWEPEELIACWTLVDEEIFRAASGGWTLHQLRQSAITHLAEDDVGLALLMAKSRHTSLRSLQRYARPGADAVAALTAAHDRDRRRR